MPRTPAAPTLIPVAAVLAFAFLFGSLAEHLYADATWPELERLAFDSKSDFRGPNATDLDQARQDLRETAERVAERLGRKAAAWKDYLLWSTLEKQFVGGNEEDVGELTKTLQRCSGNHAGLELPEFAALRAAIRRYVGVVDGLQDSAAAENYERRITLLETSLGGMAENPSSELVDAIVAETSWLERRGLARPLVQRIRERFSVSNLQLSVSDDLIQSLGERTVDVESPVRDEILGTDINGTSRTSGKVQVGLQPNTEAAAVQMIFRGQSLSETVGVNGPARIQSESVTDLVLSKTITLSGEGITSAPAETQAVTKTTTKDVQAQLDGFLALFVSPQTVVTEVRQRIRQNKDRSQRIAAQHAEERFSRQFDTKTDEPLREANEKYLDHIRNPLLRHDQFPSRLRLTSDTGAIYLSALVYAPGQLGASDQPPRIAENLDLVFAMHESLANNLCDTFLAGKKFERDGIQRVLSKILGTQSKAEELVASQDAVEMKFADEKPLRVHFNDQQVAITVRGHVSGSDRTDPPAQWTVRYEVRKTDDGVHVKRVEDTGTSGDLDAAQAELREVLEGEWTSESVRDRVVLPGLLERLGDIEIEQLTLEDGWLLVAGIHGVEAESSNEESR